MREKGEFRADSRSPDWLGVPLAVRLGMETKLNEEGAVVVAEPKKDCPKLNAILATWLKNAAFLKIEKEDRHRKTRGFYVPKTGYVVASPTAKFATDDELPGDPDDYQEDLPL